MREDVRATPVPRLEPAVIPQRQRPRADEGHLAAQHVDHVRDLVEREAAEEAADTGHAWVVTDLEERARRLVGPLERRLAVGGAGDHGAELEHREGLLSEPDAVVGVEDGAPRGELDRERDQEPDRKPEHDHDRGDHEVEDPLDHPVGAGQIGART
jgi:hypothetical protein